MLTPAPPGVETISAQDDVPRICHLAAPEDPHQRKAKYCHERTLLKLSSAK